MKERLPLRHSDLGIKRGPIRPHSPLQRKIDGEIPGFLYNFVRLIPYDNDDQPSNRGNRAVFRAVNAWNITQKEWHEQRGYSTHGSSLRALHQTGEEFFQTIDQVMAIFDVDPEEARRSSRPEEQGGMTVDETRVFHKRLEPVYRRLRTIGYTENELTA